MNSHRGLAAAAVAVLVTVGCAAPIRVTSYVERGAELSRYRTFELAPVDDAPTGDPRLDNNAFFNERIRAAATRGLASRGYERLASSEADLVVHFHASVVQDIDIVALDRQRGYCQEDGCRPFAYEAGTLVMDLVDSRTGKLVWRGWAESSFEGLIDNQLWLEERIDTAIGRIIATLPRRAS